MYCGTMKNDSNHDLFHSKNKLTYFGKHFEKTVFNTFFLSIVFSSHTWAQHSTGDEDKKIIVSNNVKRTHN